MLNCNGPLGQFRDRGDLMVRAVAYLGRNPGTSLDDMASFTFGLYHGPGFAEGADPRPDNEREAA